MLNIKMEAANMTEQPIAVLAEEPGEEPDDENTTDVTLPGTIKTNSAVNKVTGTVLKDIKITTYTSEEDIPAGAETIEIDETTDRLVTDEGSMVTIRGSYSAECEGLDIYLSNEGTTTAKRTLKYTNSDSTEFLSASQIVEEAGGSHIYGIDKYLDSELESIEDGNFEISFTSKGDIYHKTAFDHVGELVLYDYNVENALDFFEEVGIGAQR